MEPERGGSSTRTSDFSPREARETRYSVASAAAKRGVPVVLSNHDVPLIRELYADARLESFPVQRFISCNGARRGAARELLAVFP